MRSATSKPVAMTVTLTFSPSCSSMLAPKMMFASSCACSWTRLAASWISRILRSGPPTMLMSTPVAPSTEMSSRSGERDGHLGGEARAVLALGAAGAHERAAHAAHDRLHVGEVDVDDAVLRDEVADALDRLVEDLVRLAEGVDEREVVLAEHEELLVRDRDQRVDRLGELREAELGAARALPALEEERLGHDADRERALFTRELRDDRRRAGAGAAAHAGGDEDHVGAADELLDALVILQRGLAAVLGIGAGAEAARDRVADVRAWSARRCR